MKIKAETPTSAQHNGTGIDSIISFESAGSTKMGVVSWLGSGAVMSGCVFDILTVGGAGFFGSGIIAMRAVSFLGPGDGVTRGGGAAGIDDALCARGGGGGGASGGSTIDSAIDGVWRAEGTGSAIEGTGKDGACGG